MKKKPLVITLVILGLILVVVIVAPFFIDVDHFRPQITAQLSSSLGRQVEVGHLRLSLITGSLTAEQISIADDPAFSREPFLTAKSLSVGVDLLSLVFSRELRVRSLAFDAPQVQLIRAAAGRWNFQTLGAGGARRGDPPGDPPAPSSELSRFSVGKLVISNGTIAFGRPGSRIHQAYKDVGVTAQNISQTSAFPIEFSAHAPGGGKLNLKGQVGPIGQNTTGRTPFEGKLKADGVPAEDVQNLLAVLGYGLPAGSSLKGGTIQADLAFHGPLDGMVTSGPVKLQNVTLAGFSLASKIAGALHQAGAATGNDTFIQLARSQLRYAPEGLRADNLDIVIPLIGSVTGAGTVAANNRLNFRLVAKLGSNSPLGALGKLLGGNGGGGLAFRVEGTTSDPVIVPELAANPLSNPANLRQNLGGAFGNLLKKKPR